MAVFRIEITPIGKTSLGPTPLVLSLHETGLAGLTGLSVSKLVLLEGALSLRDVAALAADLLVDPVTETGMIVGEGDALPAAEPGAVAVEVHRRPGVMDPEAESTLAELRAEGYAVDVVRTARRYVLQGALGQRDVVERVGRVLANDCIEQVVPGTAGACPAPRPPTGPFTLRRVPMVKLDAAALERLSRDAHLFLSRAEMEAIRDHFGRLGREPTDVELETLAQTWSEHCVHKTLRSRIVYRGGAFPTMPQGGEPVEIRYGNLLRDTIARATQELIGAGRGPRCLSVFEDNAGVIAFDDEFGIAFKVETHNHPSAIEPYGGATTGIGGVIRDVIGCGLGAKPIASTDVFCVAPSDWPVDGLPKGVLHPRRVLQGIVHGVADYGNRMGIPTVNGAVCFDARYLGNPLVFCGSVGMIPRDMIRKSAQPGDHVLVIGGRTGRDGIHGATFSSSELTDTHAEEFSHAVQIGNAITEKRFLDALLQARDAAGGCLYTAITDCGAGGLSSSVGEMAEHIGAVVELERVPLKYAGLRYDEIWISEAQERMVVAVPPENLAQFLQIMQAEEVEATAIGVFGGNDGDVGGRPRIVLRYDGHVVGELDMQFLHHGLPQVERVAEWWPAECGLDHAAHDVREADGGELLKRLVRELARANVASKEWIIRQYDHEVQGGSVIKPLVGPGRGPGDAAVLRPRLNSQRGIALGCGLAAHLADADPYWMAVASIDEAIRNVVCVGGDPNQTAVLDNFCWGRSDDPRQLGALVRACQACHDAALAYGVPFISGKDSLNNEFALGKADVEPLLAALRRRASAEGRDAGRLRVILPSLDQLVRERGRLAIPPTLLISAVSIVDDVRRCVTPDLKHAGNQLLLLGGLRCTGFALPEAARVHRAVAELMRRGLVVACHDVADGGWLVTLAEMAIAGERGVELAVPGVTRAAVFEECCAAYVVETPDSPAVRQGAESFGVQAVHLGRVAAERVLTLGHERSDIGALRAAWAGLLQS